MPVENEDEDFARVGQAAHEMIAAAGELTAKQWVGTLAAVCGVVVRFCEEQGGLRRDGEVVAAEQVLQHIHDGAQAFLEDARAKAAEQQDATANPPDAS